MSLASGAAALLETTKVKKSRGERYPREHQQSAIYIEMIVEVSELPTG
jgi:hypothetical protein